MGMLMGPEERNPRAMNLINAGELPVNGSIDSHGLRIRRLINDKTRRTWRGLGSDDTPVDISGS